LFVSVVYLLFALSFVAILWPETMRTTLCRRGDIVKAFVTHVFGAPFFA
jgi:hypothetical protein